MMPLCQRLGITVNELLSGERLAQEEYQEKAEERMVELCEKQFDPKTSDRQFLHNLLWVLGLSLAWMLLDEMLTYVVLWIPVIMGVLGLYSVLGRNHQERIGPVEFTLGLVFSLLLLLIGGVLLFLRYHPSVIIS